MSNITIDPSESGIINVNFSLWNGPVQTWNTQILSIDDDFNLHGFVILTLAPKMFNTTGKHEFLDWSLKAIAGNFVHGKLEGIVTVSTWRGQHGAFTFQNGVMHGPAILYGAVAILDIE